MAWNDPALAIGCPAGPAEGILLTRIRGVRGANVAKLF
jgi:hypothetical protein